MRRLNDIHIHLSEYNRAKAESALDVDALVERAVAGVRKIIIN